MSEVPAEPVLVTDVAVAEPVLVTDVAVAEPVPAEPAAVENGPGPEPGPEAVPVPPLFSGDVVFFDAPVYGESDPGVYAGIVLHSGDGRARVHTLGLAADSADFPAAELRLNA